MGIDGFYRLAVDGDSSATIAQLFQLIAMPVEKLTQLKAETKERLVKLKEVYGFTEERDLPIDGEYFDYNQVIPMPAHLLDEAAPTAALDGVEKNLLSYFNPFAWYRWHQAKKKLADWWHAKELWIDENWGGELPCWDTMYYMYREQVYGEDGKSISWLLRGGDEGPINVCTELSKQFPTVTLTLQWFYDSCDPNAHEVKIFNGQVLSNEEFEPKNGDCDYRRVVRSHPLQNDLKFNDEEKKDEES